MSILMLGRGVGRQAREVGRQGGSLDLSFSLYLVLGSASRPRPTRNKQTHTQTDRQGSSAEPPTPSHPGTKNELCDIGTQILYFQCFVTTDMFLFCKPIIFSGNCRICRDLAFGSIKTRFKAILKSRIFRPRSTFRPRFTFFMNFCPRRATKLRSLYCIYNFNLHLHYIYIYIY